MVRCTGQWWEVVAENDRGGIIVREGEAISTSKLHDRLATGALVAEQQLLGERLHYKKLTGAGPAEGWVGIKLGGRELLRRVEPKVLDLPGIAVGTGKWQVVADPWVPFREHPTRLSRVVGAARLGEVLSFLEVRLCPVHGNPYGRHDWVDRQGKATTGWISLDPELLQPVFDGLAAAALAALDDAVGLLQDGDIVTVLEDFRGLRRGQHGLVCEATADSALLHFDHQDATEGDWLAQEEFTKLRVLRSEVCVDDERWAELAAESLCVNGYCLLRAPQGLAPGALCDRCASASNLRLQALLRKARRMGLDPERDVIEFAELCARAEGCLRYDLALSVEGPGADIGLWSDVEAWEELHAYIDHWAQPVLLAHLGKAANFDRSGCVTSLPGAPQQPWHQDGGVNNATGLLNAFMPLVPLSFENGPTEFLPFAVPPRTMHQEDVPPVAPLPGRGELLLFDYRVFHRGLPNESAQPRPVAYVVYARPGASDRHNFPIERLEKE